jgi:hypothetical protein
MTPFKPREPLDRHTVKECIMALKYITAHGRACDRCRGIDDAKNELRRLIGETP